MTTTGPFSAFRIFNDAGTISGGMLPKIASALELELDADTAFDCATVPSELSAEARCAVSVLSADNRDFCCKRSLSRF